MPRPKLPNDSRPSQHVSLKLHGNEYFYVQLFAARDGLSRHGWLRRLVQRELGRRLADEAIPPPTTGRKRPTKGSTPS